MTVLLTTPEPNKSPAGYDPGRLLARRDGKHLMLLKKGLRKTELLSWQC
jgi:hypothetical protein